jgi:hypothetical protein
MTSTNRYVTQALDDNGLIELRHQNGNHWTSGWFNNADALLAAARKWYKVGNLFISLNRPLSRDAGDSMDSVALRDNDIEFYTRIFFDFDPLRPKDYPSTDRELEEARRAAVHIRDVHRNIQWPDPIVAISGNGAHLLYRTWLPNTEEIRDMLAVMYTGLHEDHDGTPVQFDKSVRNPARIGPLYGSVKRKGIATTERPYRQSRIIEWPKDWTFVTPQMIDKVASYYAQRQSINTKSSAAEYTTFYLGSGDYDTLDVVAWFTKHGLYRRFLGPYRGAGRHAVQCPWEYEHSNTGDAQNTSTVIFTSTGDWPGFHCSHDHCEGRSIRDVMQLFGDADRFCARQWGDHHG